ncbi:MFS transporter [Simiduia sp. 21SJ11W-1]|uniref:VC0807 family protein n=1 Tax=Simiduia sp. 21SJ11W-1 TaxID=2909669 RepID=UPI00209E0F0D|nr:VC0807 family protein [Simiduia sp. 21SJ11W-1]UTA49300.1 MFS transporter [Simiduia sp. 21SJ11W-1]
MTQAQNEAPKEPGTPAAAEPQATKPPERENLLINLLFNIVIPTVILTKFSNEAWLGTKFGLIVALAFPLFYGLRDFKQRGKFNFFSILGIVSVLLTGGISLMELPPEYIAIKEAAIPGLLGLATLFSLKTRFPLVRTFIYNDQILKVDVVDRALDKYNNHPAFEAVLRNATYLLACSFFVSSTLNYVLAKWIVVSNPGTEAFNEELGKMTALSYPVIVVPAMAIMIYTLFYLFRNIKKLTHLDFEDLLHDA